MLSNSQSNLQSNLFTILSVAENSYRKETQLNLSHQPSFNILRVLAAYKDIYPNHNHELYHTIMAIMHKYKPKTISDWQWAVNQLNHTSSHTQLLNSSPQSTHQKQNLTSNHYISFYPHDNKENILHQNTSNHQLYNSLLDNHQYLSAKHQSTYQLHQQIYHRNRNNSVNPSPYLSKGSTDTPFNKSKLTHNTKQLTENGDQQNDHYQSMLMRADIFYRINSYMKCFSVLLANFAAFYQFRQSLNKSHSYLHNNLKTKAWISLCRSLQQAKRDKSKANIADNHRRNYSLRKVIRVLKVLYETKIRGYSQNVSTSKYTLTCIDFIIVLLLQQLKQNHQSTDSTISTEASTLFSKAIIHQSAGNVHNIHTLLLNFGHYSPSLHQINHIYTLKKLRIMQKVFKKFKIYLANRKQIRKQNQIILLHKCFNVLVQLKQKRNHNERLVLVAKVIRDKRQTHKVFNILVQFFYYRKVYLKKIFYISERDNTRVKILYLTKWIKQYNMIKMKKETNQQKVVRFTHIIIKSYQKSIFSYIKKYSLFLQSIQQTRQKNNNKEIISKVFSLFKYNYQIRNKIKIVRKNYDNYQTKNMFNYWKYKAKLAKIFTFIQTIINKYDKLYTEKYFKKIKIHNYIEQQKIYDLKQLIFDTLKRYLIQKKNQNKLNYQRLQQYRKKVSFIIFMYNSQQSLKFTNGKKNILKIITKDQLNLNTEEQNKITNRNVKNFYEIRIRKFYSILELIAQQSKSIKNKQKQLLQKIKQKRIMISLQLIVKQLIYKNSQQKIKKLKAKQISQNLENRLNNNLIKLKKIKIKNNIKKKIITYIISKMKYQKQQMNKKQQKACEKYKINLQRKYMIYLAMQLILSNQKIVNLQKVIIYQFQFLSESKKISTLKQLKYITLNTKINKLLSLKVSQSIFMKRMKIYYNKQNIKRNLKNLKKKWSYMVFYKSINQIKKHYLQQDLKEKQCQTKTQKLQSFLFYSRFCNFFVQTMLNRKYQCTAIKFRVLCLYRKGLNSLQKNYYETKGIKIQKHGHRNNLSTQYSIVN